MQDQAGRQEDFPIAVEVKMEVLFAACDVERAGCGSTRQQGNHVREASNNN